MQLIIFFVVPKYCLVAVRTTFANENFLTIHIFYYLYADRKKATANIGFAIVGQTWLIEHFYYYLAFVQVLNIRTPKPNHRKALNVMPHCRTTVTEQNFVTCGTNYISKNEWTN